MVPKGIYIRLVEPGKLEIFRQCVIPIGSLICLGEANIVLQAVPFDLFNTITQKRQYLLPFLLIEHRHVDLATPTVKRLCHRIPSQ